MGVGVGNGGPTTNTSTAGNSNINNMTTSVQGSCGAPSERNASLQERIIGVGGCSSSSTGAVLTSANSVASSSGGGVGASSSSITGTVGGTVPGMGSPIRGRGCPTGLPASMIGSCGGAGDSMLRKSRSQGGKKLQKCLSTASYGEESSLTRPQMTPPSHNLLVTRQYCSFGSTTSNSKKVFFFGYVLFGLFFFYVVVLVHVKVISSPARYQIPHDNIRSTSGDDLVLIYVLKNHFITYYLSKEYQKANLGGLGIHRSLIFVYLL